MKMPIGSRRLSWYIAITTTGLTILAILHGMEGAASALFTAGTGSAVGIYANKQYQERKNAEIIEKGNNNG